VGHQEQSGVREGNLEGDSFSSDGAEKVAENELVNFNKKCQKVGTRTSLVYLDLHTNGAQIA